GGGAQMVTIVPASPEFFPTLQIPLLRGRLFNAADGPETPRVAIINREAARRFFGNEEPIGQLLPILMTDTDKRPTEVVGVVENVKFTGIAKPDEATIYSPFAQLPMRHAFLVARGDGDPASIAGEVRRIVAERDKDSRLNIVRPLNAWVSDSVALPRFRAVLL